MSTEVAPEAVGSSNASANGRRPVPTGSTSPSHPTVQLALATILILSGLSLAVINGTTPTYQSSVLAESGNFFALAETGSTLFAASGDGGSILLERSTDHGVDWTQNPVPYSAVAGGSPWVLAAIAASGSDLLLAAATRAVGGTPYPAGVGPAYPTSPCGSNSTVLTAFSSDGGITWNTSTLSLPDASATSLQAEINGKVAAVAWTGETVDCYNTTGEVQAVTSLDGGADWSAVQSMTPVGAFIPIGEQIEMAPDQGGLVVAFGSVANGQSSAQLRLWEFSAEYPDGFVPIAVLPAPSGWTLQGAGSTPAYLLTPTYLIPLSRPPYTALPFDQLQTDGGGIGLLPTVVSLVPVGQGTLEIAATTPDNLGVDCWHVDVTDDAVTQTCHVLLSASLTSATTDLPIVALIDDGNGWVAIGASGTSGVGCPPACNSPPQYNGSPVPVAGTSSSAAGATVGTSVCFTGCSSGEGLAAYSFAPSSGAAHGEVAIVAGMIASIGAIWLLAAWSYSRRRPPSTPSEAPIPEAGEPSGPPTGTTVQGLPRRYRIGLAAWAFAWFPLALVAFVPNSTGNPAVVVELVVGGTILGSIAGLVFQGEVRRRLVGSADGSLEGWMGGEVTASGPPRDSLAAQTAIYAYGSWLSFAALLGLLFLTFAGGFGENPLESSGGAAQGPGVTAIGGLIALVLIMGVGLRALYHRTLAATASAARGDSPPATRPADWSKIRTDLGAVLLVWNPLAGLLLGVALPGVFPWGPLAVAEASLPITLLGIALLAGGFGRTRWVPSSTGSPVGTAR